MSQVNFASATDEKAQNVVESLKKMIGWDSDTCWSVASVSVVKPAQFRRKF